MDSNFKLIDKKELPEINSTGLLYRHEGSGATVLHLANSDENKVFCAAFKTPAKDSTGLPHIMEHSVLNGSEKFRVKDPFMELSRGSLVTFLNAMTYPDKTLYPVASYNQKDFLNLCEVYLDSVFFPLIHKRKESFLQEGWHYETDENGKLIINGVVYSEMKGAFSDVKDYTMRKAMEMLFPDTDYGNEAGGDPEFIPDLSYEQYCQFHRDYYHPSNAMIVFYGDMDIEPCFTLLHNDYLSKFSSRDDIDSSIALQKPFAEPLIKDIPYPVNEGDETVGRNQLMAQYCFGEITDVREREALALLYKILLKKNSSPLKQALQKAELGEDVSVESDEDMRQVNMCVMVTNSAKKALDLKAEIDKCLKELVRTGIDPELIEAVLNSEEFTLREAEFGWTPKGLLYGMTAISGWHHGQGVFEGFDSLKHIDEFRAMAKDRYFEKLIEKYFIDARHCVYLTAVPEQGLNNKREAELAAKLEKFRSGLSAGELQEIEAQTKRLREFQNSVDTKEALQSIPRIGIQDIAKESAVLPLEERTVGGAKILYSELDTSGIVYANFHFNAEAEEPGYLGLLYTLLGSVDTEKRGYSELANELSKRFGGFRADFFVKDGKAGDKRYLVLDTKALSAKAADIYAFADEVLNHSLFTDKKRIKELLGEIKSGLEQMMSRQGHVFSATKAASFIRPLQAYYDKAKGIEYYRFISALLADYDNNFDTIVKKLRETEKAVFSRDNCLLSLCCSKGDYDRLAPLAAEFVGKLPSAGEKHTLPETAPDKAAYTTSWRVQYNAVAMRYDASDYSGHLPVIQNIIREEWLYNELRAKGGAYGMLGGIERGGLIKFASYRDPQLENSYDVFSKTADYLRGLKLEQSDLDKYIIGTVNTLDQPLSPGKKHERALERYFQGLNRQDIQRERDEVLGTKPADVNAFASVLDKAAPTKTVCTLGSAERVAKTSGIFDKVVSLGF